MSADWKGRALSFLQQILKWKIIISAQLLEMSQMIYLFVVTFNFWLISRGHVLF